MTKKKYKHIFFDLDNTLWDYQENARVAIHTIFNKYELYKLIGDVEAFLRIYYDINEKLWASYRKGQINKEELRVTRFNLALKQFNIKNIQLAKSINDDFIKICSESQVLIPGTIEILNYLSVKYNMNILTNGFKETQYTKLRTSGIFHYFNKIFTSDNTGYAKPNLYIYQKVLTSLNAKKEECIMVGDDFEIDILSAKSFGIDQIYFNPFNKITDIKPTYEINSLTEICSIL